MATSLQQQLAAIAANSTHQLDLKAQKARHSKSLLFEPRDAATQSFDTIYQLCYEGFEELCMLDARFSAYERNLFSEQSRNEDRTQMTAQENEELDRTVDSFLGLVGGRLLLKPAMKAVEWLVRRFRVQEYNTETVLLTFLPYHTSHIFPTLLSILPEQLPATFRFLHPYVASLQSPPRHAVLAATINNPGFFSAFSQYVLRVANARHHSAVLLGFWASITAQAVNGMIDSTRSGRDAVRKQREEDLLLRVLPILQTALSIKGVPELYLGSCMIMTIFATKASLEDRVLDAMMEAIAGAWTAQTIEDGMTCLAVMAEEKSHAALPKVVMSAVVTSAAPLESLRELSQRHRVDRLALGLCLGSIDFESGDFDGAAFAKGLLKEHLLSEPCLVALIDSLLQRANERVNHSLLAFVNELGTDVDAARLLQERAAFKNIDLEKISLDLLIAPQPAQAAIEGASDAMDLDVPSQQDESEPALSLKSLPELDDARPSFLDPTNDTIFWAFLSAFEKVSASQQVARRFLSLRTLRRDECMSKPTFLSFLARASISSQQVGARALALEVVASELQRHIAEPYSDMQALVPYLIAALADVSQKPRRAAAQAIHVVRKLYGVSDSKEKVSKNVQMWCPQSIYGERSSEAHMMSSADAYRFLSTAVMPMLEDCVLDGRHVLRALPDLLKGSHGASGKDIKELKASVRAEACASLASHVPVTPVIRAKLHLLAILNKAGKSASDARKKFLREFVRTWAKMPEAEVQAACSAEAISIKEIDCTILASLTGRSDGELSTIQEVCIGELGATGSWARLRPVAFDRLRRIWTSLTVGSQAKVADWLLNIAVGDLSIPNEVEDDALETLRTLQYPSEVLVHLVETLPNASELQDQPSSAKKRRTSSGESSQPKKADAAKVNAAVKRITTVLEVVEGAKPEKHSQLLKGLFHLLSELHQYKALLGSQLVYMQGILMSDLLAVVNGLKASPVASDVDRSVIRTDLIVECVRTTSSTQVHNTALLLISSLASWAPELVLHSVMPLFTFMSTTLLRQSDDFSAHVTDQTVSRIVPPLAASLRKRGKDLVSGASELLLSFTAAFEHIPLHRRSGLFQHLVQTLGPEESLFAVSAMLVERYPSDSRVQPFVGELMGHFPVVTQLKGLKQYLDLIFDALKAKRSLSDVILAFGEKDAEQREESVDTLIQGLANLLAGTALRKKVAREFGKDDKDLDIIRTTYAQMLEQTMQLNSQLNGNEDLKDSANAVLASLLSLLPTKDFIESSAQLMQAGSDATRQQVFSSLETRVVQAKLGDASLQQTFLEVLPNCCVFVSKDQPVPVRHAAVACIDQIVEKYGKRDRGAALHAAGFVAGEAALESQDASMRTISTLCLSTMVEVIGDEFIPVLPKVLNQVLDYLQQAQAASQTDRKLRHAAFSFAINVLDNLPWMYSDAYLRRTLQLAGKAAAIDRPHEVEALAARTFCNDAARKVKVDTLLSAIDETFEAVVDMGASSTLQLLDTLHICVQHNKQSSLQASLQTLYSIMLKAFDLRRTKSDQEEFGDVYSRVDNIALDVVYKLNNSLFRPFFMRLVEWATNELPKKDAVGRTLREISLYSFAHVLFERLQSIVTTYADYLKDNAAYLLETLSPKDELQRELQQVLLQALSSSFRYDDSDFWQGPSHFDAIAAPLLVHLTKAKLVDVTQHIIPAVTDLAAAAASSEHHKTMNTLIMSYMRHDDAAVRLAAVKCERSITDRLGLDWLSLLPEMLPFISELQEDDDENVERETLRWVRQIEEVTGESLEGMLQ